MNNVLKISSPLTQLILIGITCSIIFFSTSNFLSKFRNKDPFPHIYEFTDRENLKDSTPIEVGFYLRGIYKFDVIKNNFLIKGVVWFVYDPNKISIETLQKFTFFRGHLIDKQMLEKKDEKNLGPNKKLARFFVTLRCSSNLDFALYPLDDHRIYFTLDNKFLPLDKAHFVINPKNFKLEGDLHIPGWEFINTGVKVGYTKFILDNNDLNKTIKFPRIIFYADFHNDNIKDIVIIFLPLFITFFIVAFFFSIEYAKHQDLITAIMGTAIPAILSYRFVIDNLSPKVSYFMFVDYIFALFIILSFVIFLLNFYLEKIKTVKTMILIAIYLILLISWNYFLYCVNKG